ncbi:DHH family phosphoesterase, partial [Desulfofundulus sp.]|uniref:DHH family phosphoesterase n=1 Tax=Desulfofundulus sp. TaxID=2282750 RepID=UPI003C70C14B
MPTLVTHNDFDGITCAVLFKAAYPLEGNVHITNYDEVDEVIRKACDEPGVLFVTDISPQSKEVADLLKSRGEAVWLFDHHKTAGWLSKYPYAHINTEKCGARLFYDFLRPFHPNLQEYEQLVWHANDYDLWRHESPHSVVLNRLLHVLGHDEFLRRFVYYPDVNLTDRERYLMGIEEGREQRYIEEAIKTAVVYNSITPSCAIVFAEQYISQVGHKLLETYPVDVAVIVNFQKNTVSLRSRDKGVDVSEIAKALGGGGHPTAAGFMLPRNKFRN